MKYMLLNYANPSQAPNYTPEEAQAAWQGWTDVVAEMKAAGVYVTNDGLSAAAEARTVRVRDNKTLTAEGPFAKTEEQLTGYFMIDCKMIDCKDLDEAIRWAAKTPGAQYGSVEVHPVVSYS